MSRAACSDPRALRQRLRVTAVSKGRISLEGARAAACSGCAARSGCGVGALAELAGGRLRLTMPRPEGVMPGDEVIVVLPAAAFLGAAGLAYLLPPAALVMALALCAALGLPDLWSALLCLPVLGVSLLPLRRAELRGAVTEALHIEDIVPAGTGAGKAR
ncbi:SoxR reducing system RseC family protein [Alloyangia pacifica]|uniref:Positive regulator of sigma(E), RseC/MucC n=1 Tax=Alloyangia pacifica TaxID=311180 RepID=A0A1I6QTS9_9RHOB|nr:SoxR reducing system RseC family protein [Alloyangia pacifica]SDF98475.1 positive regulator of sigma(E), RseC/MucC [Alloyangia pacifica]SFS55698.1 positive regulator of sigma(E), RseC/MucC [Alloyangia pacifica]